MVSMVILSKEVADTFGGGDVLCVVGMKVNHIHELLDLLSQTTLNVSRTVLDELVAALNSTVRS